MEFGLHNTRGLDKGIKLIVAGFIKGLFKEIGLPLSNIALAYGCLSCRTLARVDKRLTADVLISVVQDLKSNNVTWIALMVDHGKRNGIEHFVEIRSSTQRASKILSR